MPHARQDPVARIVSLAVMIVGLGVLALVVFAMLKAREGKLLRYPVNFRLIKQRFRFLSNPNPKTTGGGCHGRRLFGFASVLDYGMDNDPGTTQRMGQVLQPPSL